MKTVVLFLLFTVTLFASQLLKEVYYIEGDTIRLSDVVSTNKDIILFHIEDAHYMKRLRSYELIEILKKYGFTDFRAKHPYVTFEKKSPIDTSKIVQMIQHYYYEHYENIKIKSITLYSHEYIMQLPTSYQLKMQRKNFLKNKAVCAIITPEHKQIFFDYTIEASLFVYVARKDIARGDPLLAVNTAKKSIILQNFRSRPLTKFLKNGYEAKTRIKKGKIITQREITSRSLIKRGAIVNVILNNNNIVINFSAKALKNGKYGDIISVQNSNGKKIRVQVIGINRAKVI